MAFPRAARALGLSCRVDVQHDTSDFGPVGSISFCIEEAEVRHEVFVVAGQHVCGRGPRRRPEGQEVAGASLGIPALEITHFALKKAPGWRASRHESHRLDSASI